MDNFITAPMRICHLSMLWANYVQPQCLVCCWYLMSDFSMLFPGVKCPVPAKVAMGRVTPMLTEYFYRDYIFVRCDQGYKLMVVRFNFLFFHPSKHTKKHIVLSLCDADTISISSLFFQDGEEIESFSTMCQSNGQWHLPLPECHSMSPLGSEKNCKMNGKQFHDWTSALVWFSTVIDCGEPEPLLNGGVIFLSGSQNQYLSVVQYHCNEPYYALLGGQTSEIFLCNIFWCMILYLSYTSSWCG